MQFKSLLSGIYALVIGASVGMAQPQEPTGSWAAIASISASGADAAFNASATDGTYMYIFGGDQISAGVQRRDVLRRYDPSNDTWTLLANMPVGVTQAAGAYFGGRLFSFGGFAVGGVGPVMAYTISTNAWATLAPDPAPLSRRLHAAATLGSKIYLTGGTDMTDMSGPVVMTTAHEEFDPTNDSFTTRAPLPAARSHLTMSAVESSGRLYALGGLSQSFSTSADCYEYSQSSDTWTERPSMAAGGTSAPRYALRAFTLLNRIYVLGGAPSAASSAESSLTLEFDPESGSWIERATMSSTRVVHNAAAINGKGYVYGGATGTGRVTGEVFTSPIELLEVISVSQSGSNPESSLQNQGAVWPHGWTTGQINISAAVNHEDPTFQVRFRVRVKGQFTGAWTELDSGMQPLGSITLTYAIPADGAFDWQYRIEDQYGRSIPEGTDAYLDSFGNSLSPDFASGQPPEDEIPLAGGGGGDNDHKSRCQSGVYGSGSLTGLLAGLTLLVAASRRQKKTIC